MIRRHHRRRYFPPPDDGKVALRGYIVSPAEMNANAQALMAGFDDLPKKLRDQINYALTAEEGANPPADILRGERLRKLESARSSMINFINSKLDQDDS